MIYRMAFRVCKIRLFIRDMISKSFFSRFDRYPERSLDAAREDFHHKGRIFYSNSRHNFISIQQKNANQSEQPIVTTDDREREDRRSSRGRVVVRCSLSFIIHRGHLRGSRLVFAIVVIGRVGFIIIIIIIIIGRREYDEYSRERRNRIRFPKHKCA